MDTISPAMADAFQLLRNDLYEHLDHADELATNCDEWSDEDVETARKLIPDLLLVIRGCCWNTRSRLTAPAGPAR